MAKMIDVTNSRGRKPSTGEKAKTSINIDNIITIVDNNSTEGTNAKITFADGSALFVEENKAKILEMIKNYH